MRRRHAEKREALLDSKYNNKLVAKFINAIMLEGKKSLAERIVYKALSIVSEKSGRGDVMEVFQKALANVRPRLMVKSRRIGGATYQVPVEVKPERSASIALRWIRDGARARAGKPMEERLAEELLEAYKGTGSAVKKRENAHKMAEANKAFAHYRW